MLISYHRRRALRPAALKLEATPPPALVAGVEPAPPLPAGVEPSELTAEQLEAATAPTVVPEIKRSPGRPPNPR